MSDRQKFIDAAEEKERLTKVTKTEKETLLAAYKTVFRSELGKLVLEDLKKKYRHGKTVFVADNERINIFAQGAQGVVNEIINKLEK
mgnify:CR=1 FL=1